MAATQIEEKYVLQIVLVELIILHETYRIIEQIYGERLEIVLSVANATEDIDNFCRSLEKIVHGLGIHGTNKAATFLNVKVQVLSFVIGDSNEIRAHS